MIKFDLNNRVAIVTGGAQGFGLSITEVYSIWSKSYYLGYRRS